MMLAVIALAISCSHPNTAANAPPPPARPHAAETTATISPAVDALLRPDPDVDGKLTEAEIRATLAAARATTPRQAPSDSVAPSSAEGGQWAKMEADQKARLARDQRYLEQTVVYAGPDGLYHRRGCRKLMEGGGDPATPGYVLYKGEYVPVQPRFVGRAITLQDALDSHLQADPACSPPSYNLPSTGVQ
jgi:hypothetical protein